MKKLMAKKFAKEVLAIAGGMGFAYFFQLFCLFMLWKQNREFVEPRMFLPEITLQLIMAPMVAWCLMGIFKVNWLERWKKITKVVCSFMIPFTLISVATVYIEPAMWDNAVYWMVNVVVSAAVGLKMFKTPISSEE